jgi:hypothetical protein
MEQEKALREGFKLWEQFTSSYSNMMFEAMERTLEGSETLKKQMDKAVEQTMKTWSLPAKGADSELAAMVQELVAQVQTLTEKVAQLENKISIE